MGWEREEETQNFGGWLVSLAGYERGANNTKLAGSIPVWATCFPQYFSVILEKLVGFQPPKS